MRRGRMGAVLAVLLGVGPAARAWIEVEGAVWAMQPSGEGAVGEGGFRGTRLDVERDLGFAREDNLLSLRVVVGDRHQFGLAHLGTRLSGRNELEKNVRFHDLFFPAGTRLGSDLSASAIQGFYRFCVGPSFVRGGAYVGLQHMDFDLEVKAEEVGRASNRLRAVMPLAGVFFLGHPVRFFGVRASAEGFAWDLGDGRASFWDLELAVEWNVGGGFYAAGGYRQTRARAKDNDLPADVELELAGPILYVGYEW